MVAKYKVIIKGGITIFCDEKYHSLMSLKTLSRIVFFFFLNHRNNENRI